MSVDDIKIPSINDLTEVPEKMGDGITWYVDLTTLKIYGFSHISNTWFPSYDKDFDKLVMCRIFDINLQSIGNNYGSRLLSNNNKSS